MADFVTTTSHKSRKKALLLCIFFGMVGAHYFYVGRYFRGLLALCTMNFVMIGWFFDIRKIARGRFKDQYGEYLKK